MTKKAALLKCLVKMCVFKNLFNIKKESVFRRKSWREFHVVGAEVEKDVLPLDWREHNGVERKRASNDMSVLEGLEWLISVDRYVGATSG